MLQKVGRQPCAHTFVGNMVLEVVAEYIMHYMVELSWYHTCGSAVSCLMQMCNILDSNLDNSNDFICDLGRKGKQ